MTRTEFDQWWQDLGRRFPSIPIWLSKLEPMDDRTTADAYRLAVLRTWYDVLAPVALEDALQVNKRIQTGELPEFGSYDSGREQVPVIIKRHCLKSQFERERGTNFEDQPRPIPKDGFSAGQCFRRICELLDKGLPENEAKVLALEELPKPKDIGWQPRYHCPICLDCGRVEVASPTAIRMMLDGVFEQCKHRVAAVRCSCAAGNDRKRETNIRYDRDKDFIVHRGDLRSEVVVKDFAAWVERQHQAYLASKRHAEFDQFNAVGAT